MAVALKQIQDKPQDPRDIEHTIPEHVAHAILRCLEKDPDDRFQTVLELKDALRNPSPAIGRTSAFLKNVPWAARTAVALATVVAVLFAVAFISFGRGVPPKRVPDAPPSDAEFSAFRMAESINTEEAWNTFIKEHREGVLLSVAQERVQRIQAHRTDETTPAGVAMTKTVPAKRDSAAVASTVVPKPADLAPSSEWTALTDTVLVEGGVLTMGNDTGKRDEKPAHEVRLDAFHISRNAISNRQYLLFLNDTSYPRPRDPGFAKNYLMGYPDLPVVNVSYDDAIEFCKWATAKFGTSVRLPTEAEWEQAHPAPGTDWEWVSDFYSKDYFKVSPVKNPAGPPTGTKRVVRGAGKPRDSRDPKDHNDHLGFRIVVGH
jgi:formylglycine-generating enzyme required for sulfatase activity